MRARAAAARAREDQGVTTERLRVLHRHAHEGRAGAGETEQRIYALDAWPETPFYRDRGRTALAWTEAVTRVAETRVPDEVYHRVTGHFSEADLVSLTVAVVAINGWNRLATAFRVPAGSYQPQPVPA